MQGKGVEGEYAAFRMKQQCVLRLEASSTVTRFKIRNQFQFSACQAQAIRRIA